eukprot:902775-Pelagomonas_calceolata.AAC.7
MNFRFRLPQNTSPVECYDIPSNDQAKCCYSLHVTNSPGGHAREGEMFLKAAGMSRKSPDKCLFYCAQQLLHAD